ncbi:MAG: RadC family protein [Alphaproteobacteria bacterium]
MTSLLHDSHAPAPASEPSAASDTLGHRHRLRARLIEGGTEAMADYEVLEVLLFAARPRGDTKPLAKSLIRHFGTLGSVLSASTDELKSVDGVGEAAIAAIAVVKEGARRLAAANIADRPLLSSFDALLEFCRVQLSHARIEEFHILFLDTKNRLLKHERQGVGTVDQAPVYVREVLRRALELGASALILLHNHPSGDPTPSQADITITNRIIEAGQPLGVKVHDHLIIGKSGHVSLKSKGLI